MKQFREAVPHEGYSILKKWREQLFSNPSPDFQKALMQYPLSSRSLHLSLLPLLSLILSLSPIFLNFIIEPKMEGVENPPGPFFVYTSNVRYLILFLYILYIYLPHSYLLLSGRCTPLKSRL
jgi:hypothetical protein